MEPIYVLCNPHKSPSSSCEICLFSLTCFSRFATASLRLDLVLSMERIKNQCYIYVYRLYIAEKGQGCSEQFFRHLFTLARSPQRSRGYESCRLRSIGDQGRPKGEQNYREVFTLALNGVDRFTRWRALVGFLRFFVDSLFFYRFQGLYMPLTLFTNCLQSSFGGKHNEYRRHLALQNQRQRQLLQRQGYLYLTCSKTERRIPDCY